MDHRPLGDTAVTLSAVGYGAFKIGRNQGIKYPAGYPLPDDEAVARLLNGVLDLGITYIDTAPAYGTSEERIGQAVGHRAGEFTVSTKVGEIFENGRSSFDYTAAAVEASVHRSCRRLRRDVLDIVLVHSDGRDLHLMNDTDVVEVMLDLKRRGLIRAVGFSGKTVDGARAALPWADAIMVTYHRDDRSHAEVIAEAARGGIGVIVKKPLASGHLDPADALRFVCADPGVTSAVVGTLDLDHLRENVEAVGGTNEWRPSP